MHRPLPLLLAVLLLGPQARAQCVMGNSNAPGTDATNVEIGQSFMPTCDGTLEYVEIFCSTAGTNVAGVLKIYAGSTVTSTPIHTQAQPATAVNAGEYLRITLSAPVAVTSFSPLTFELPMSLTIPYSGGNPYPGGRMFYNGTNAALYANSDIRFNASVISDCTPTTAFLQASACRSFLAPSGVQWTASGLYTDTIANVQGCDSIITIDLEVIDLDTTLTTDGLQLTANATGVDYQWLDCDNGDLPIAGADQQSYTPTTSGNYAVLVSAGGCSEQSACVFVGSTAVPTIAGTGIALRQDQGAGLLFVDDRHLHGQPCTIMDMTGRTVHQGLCTDGRLDLGALPKGQYLLRFERPAAAARFLVW